MDIKEVTVEISVLNTVQILLLQLKNVALYKVKISKSIHHKMYLTKVKVPKNVYYLLGYVSQSTKKT